MKLRAQLCPVRADGKTVWTITVDDDMRAAMALLIEFERQFHPLEPANMAAIFRRLCRQELGKCRRLAKKSKTSQL